MAEVQNHNQAGEMTQIFVEFVMQQAQNAALFLGQIPDPRRGQVEVNLPLAKMFIDQLIVIRERTSGNLKADEKKVIDSAVNELSMAYREVAQMMRARNLGGEAPADLLAIEETAQAAVSEPPPVSPVPAAMPDPPPASAPSPAPEPVKAADPTEPQESRKRFTKSYGS